MRIMLVTNGLEYGGAEMLVARLAEQLTFKGAQVRVVATTRAGPIADMLERGGIPVDLLSISSPLDARAPLQLARLAIRHGVQLIHSHLEVSDIVTALAPLPGLKRVSTVHNLGLGALKESRFKDALWRAAMLRFDRVLAVSEAVAARLPARLKPVIDRPSVVSERPPEINRIEAREALGWPLHGKIVLGIGRLEHAKGFDVLADAAQRLPGDILIKIAGEGSARFALSKSRLELLGSRNDVDVLLRAADMLVMPSRTEGLPQVAIEAMAAERPIIATRVGGTPELVVHEQTGLLVEPERAILLAKAIEKLFEAPAEAHRMGEAARGRLLALGLSVEAMAARAESLYRALLEPYAAVLDSSSDPKMPERRNKQ